MRARYLILLPLMAFAITLGIVIGERLSREAMIVILGVVAGIATSIPTSLFTVWMVARRAGPPTVTPTPAPHPPLAQEPRIIVVQTPPPAPAATVPLYAEPHRERQFNVIGGADELV